MNIQFDEKKHEYKVDGHKVISVTQLLKKHGLSPNYDTMGIDPQVLENAKNRGTIVHEDIENYIKNGEIGFTAELQDFIEYSKDMKYLISEEAVGNDVVAGTIDMVVMDGDVIKCVDFKTTSTIYKESVTWQLSIYAYLWNKSGRKPEIQEIEAWHLRDGIKAYKFPRKTDAEIEELLECERKGEIYQTKEIALNERNALLEINNSMKEIKAKLEALESRKKGYEEAILKAMEETGTTLIDDPAIRITYIPATTRVSIDTTKLKKEQPEIAKQYEKETPVKATIRITLREMDNE